MFKSYYIAQWLLLPFIGIVYFIYWAIKEFYTNDIKLNMKAKKIENKLIEYFNYNKLHIAGIELIVILFSFIISLEFFNSRFDENIVVAVYLGLTIIFMLMFYIISKKIDYRTEKAIVYKNKLIGLANYLQDFSIIDERHTMEIVLWEEYLIYSVLLGINNKITQELKINISKVSSECEIQFDYYENKYFYIDNFNEKNYI